MTSTTIVNGAPGAILRGIEDASGRTIPVEPESRPSHLPLIPIYAAKGPEGATLVTGAERTNIYGLDTFDFQKGFANHATVAASLAGATQMIKRILPDDRGPRANLLLSLEIVADDIVQYERNPDGTIAYDVDTGEPVPQLDGSNQPIKAQGYLGKWVITNLSALNTEAQFGAATQGPGTLVSSTSAQSVRYPMLQFWASYYGSDYNNAGLRIWAPTTAGQAPIDSDLMTSTGAYPFRLSVIRRATAASTPKPVATRDGELTLDFVLKPNSVYDKYNTQVSLQDIFYPKYNNLKDYAAAIVHGDFMGFHVYESNIAAVQALVYAKESAASAVNGDFTAGATDEAALVNIFGATSSKNEPYYTFSLLNVGDAVDAIRPTETTNLYAKGGADGTMSDALFATKVSEFMADYANELSQAQDTAIRQESHLYDSGYPLITKRDLCQFISLRKDTFVHLSTYVAGGAPMTMAEEQSVAAVLKTYLEMYPESDYFGTSVVRGMVTAGYGVMAASPWRANVPVTMHILDKSATMMGAGNGRWDSTKIFDRGTNAEVTLFESVNNTSWPMSLRNKSWTAGMNWVQNLSPRKTFMPALKTICGDDTSVLTNYFTVCAAMECQKIGEEVWREFSGNVTLSDIELIDEVNKSFNRRIQSRGNFAGMFVVVPEAYIDSVDEARGYSWKLRVNLYANNMKTVMTLDVRARRMSDLAA